MMEAYLAEEGLCFVSMYLEDISARCNQKGRNADTGACDVPGGFTIFDNTGHSISGKRKEIKMDYAYWDRLSRYVILNCPEVESFVR